MFLMAASFAVVMIVIWIYALRGSGPASLPVDIIYWHAHEMLIGFVLAAVAGFVLTAVATWTGRAPVSGYPLLLLMLSWLSGRLVMGISGKLELYWVAAIDMLFPLLLLALLAREVIAADNKRNYPIILIALMPVAFNAFYHAGLVGYVQLSVDAERIGLYLLMHMMLLLITVIGGRIVPEFTRNWLAAQGETRLPQSSNMLERLTILTTLITGLFAALAPVHFLTGCFALFASILHLFRLLRWRGIATRREPLLFVLHAAYLWLPFGYFLTAAAIFGWDVPATAALHALTIGGVAFMVLAVSSRVALAHTGRQLKASRLIVLAYWLLFIAAVVRVASPFGRSYLMLIDISAFAWMLSFCLFLWIYLPVLLGPSVDSGD
jgi:uncharacterized protein involved in response to NO